MNPVFQRLGLWIAQHSRVVLAAWAVAICVAAWGALLLPGVVVGGSGALQGSHSQHVDETLRAEFANPFVDCLMLTISSKRFTVDDAPYRAWIRDASARLKGVPEVRRVATYEETRDPHLRSANGHQTVLLIGLVASDVAGQERAVPIVRAALQNLKTSILQSDSEARFAVAGRAAITYDVNAANKQGGDRAESRALPLTLCILVLVFGALIAAGLPLLIGLASTTIALGLAFVLAQAMPVSNLLQNVVTMIGLAVGIDYSLLMVSHYRGLLAQRSVTEAVSALLGEAGATVAWSGLTVIVGLLGLLFSPLMETRCIGIGGALVVLVSVLAAMTLLPASLALLGPRIDWPRVLGQPVGHARAEAFWRRLAQRVVRHPFVTLVLSAGCAAAIALPGLQARSGFNNSAWFLPATMESRVGGEILADIGNANAVMPVYLVVRSSDGLPVLARSHLASLIEYVDRHKRDPRIGDVASPLTLRKDLGLFEYTVFYSDLDQTLRQYPQIGELFLNHDRSAVLFQIIPAAGLSLHDIQALARDVAATAPQGPFVVEAGGPPVYYNEFDDFMWASFPKVFGFVVAATLLLLFAAFRSYLLPVKAVAMNLLAVAAGFGAVVAVFQLGWMTDLVGLEQPFPAIPLTVPLMIFCLSFGLSMDYEVFLLSRIRREFESCGNTDQATATGLAATAPVITGAALIMAVVFGAFVGAELALLKMIGLGLTVAVVVDATLIRALIVPAVMSIAGRWNWYPGRRAAAVCKSFVTHR